MSFYIDKCPHCGASLIGAEIPENRREFFGGATHGSRLIAHVDRDTDNVTYFECPDCRAVIDREEVVKGPALGFRTVNLVIERKGEP